MADYNIYIRAIESGDRKSPTDVWSKDEESPTSSWQDNFKKGLNYAQNPDALVSSGLGFLSRAVPAVMVAFMVVKLVDKAVSFALDTYSTESGDYRASLVWSNAKANIGTFFRPFGTAINEFKAQQQYRIEDDKRRLNRELLGDSVINTYTNRGV